MRHRVKKLKIGRSKSHATAMVKNLATSLILYEKVKTTRAKAKAFTPEVEKIIGLARAVELGQTSKRVAIRELSTRLFDENASRKLLEVLAVRYKDRSSGFSRTVALGHRAGDAAEMVLVELIA